MFAVVALVNVTVPGPLTFAHDAVSLFDGSPSSDTVPASTADAGRVIVWSEPAFAVGAWFTGGGNAVVHSLSVGMICLAMLALDHCSCATAPPACS